MSYFETHIHFYPSFSSKAYDKLLSIVKEGRKHG